jgi:ribosome-associated protein
METEKLISLVTEQLDEMKCEAIQVMKIKEHSVFDALIVATCRSSRHMKSTSGALTLALKKKKDVFIGRTENSDVWTAVDLGCVVLHLFLEEARQLYDLENFWASGKAIFGKDHETQERMDTWQMNKYLDR